MEGTRSAVPVDLVGMPATGRYGLAPRPFLQQGCLCGFWRSRCHRHPSPNPCVAGFDRPSLAPCKNGFSPDMKELRAHVQLRGGSGMRGAQGVRQVTGRGTTERL